MAKDKPNTVSIPLPALGAMPPTLEEFNAERVRRAAERAKKEDVLLECIDPTVARQYEDRKATYEWQVEVRLPRPAIGNQKFYRQKFSETVVAQNDADAWAYFCDRIGEWPNRRNAKPLITRLGRVSNRPAPEMTEDERILLEEAAV